MVRAGDHAAQFPFWETNNLHGDRKRRYDTWREDKGDPGKEGYTGASSRWRKV